MQPLTMQPTQAGRRVDPDRPSAEARPINQGRALVSPFAIRRRGPVCGRSGQGAKQAPAFPLLPNPPRPLPWRPAGRPLPEPEPVRRLLSPYAGQWSPCAGCFTPPPAAATLGSVQPLDLVFTLDRMSHSYGGLADSGAASQTAAGMVYTSVPAALSSLPAARPSCQPPFRVARRMPVDIRPPGEAPPPGRAARCQPKSDSVRLGQGPMRAPAHWGVRRSTRIGVCTPWGTWGTPPNLVRSPGAGLLARFDSEDPARPGRSLAWSRRRSAALRSESESGVLPRQYQAP
jgi:hypothetical protein